MKIKIKKPKFIQKLQDSRVCNFIRTNKVLNNFMFQLFVVSFICYYIIESFEFKNFFGTISFLIQNPLGSLFNYGIIVACFSIIVFLRKRLFWFVVFSIPFLLLGIINGLVLLTRKTPFTTADIGLVKMAFSLIGLYFSKQQIVLLIAGIIIVPLLLIGLFFIAKKKERKSLKKSFAVLIGSIAITFILSNVCSITGSVSTRFLNLWDAYEDYGVVYSFGQTWLNQGIKKPSNYGEKAIDSIFAEKEIKKIIDNIKNKNESFESKDSSPNIVFLQLETFIDPAMIKGLETNKPATPYFNKLKKNFTSGYLTVPVVGGGTANTEFEAQTGMNVLSFGPGEYPYKSILKKETVETFAYDLKSLGYMTHIMHNHKATFYNRNEVFKNMGYDDFTSVEYMPYVQRNERGWAKDNVLVDQILKCMKQTKSKDYIYGISVQPHGEYSKQQKIDDAHVKVLKLKNKDMKYAYEYFLHQLKEVDDVVKTLCEKFSEMDEKVVFVLYGDHLPSLDLENEDMVTGDITKTEYVIWDNFGLPKKDKNLRSFQLSSYTQTLLNWHQGILTNFHQKYMGKKGYMSKLNLLEYDMLYGKKYIFGNDTALFPPNKKMQMGFSDIKITEILTVGNTKYIVGSGFTNFSKINYKGKILKTTFLTTSLLKINEKIDADKISDFKISQLDKNGSILSTNGE